MYIIDNNSNYNNQISITAIQLLHYNQYQSTLTPNTPFPLPSNPQLNTPNHPPSIKQITQQFNNNNQQINPKKYPMSSIQAQRFFSFPCFQLQQDQNQTKSFHLSNVNFFNFKSQHTIPLTEKKSNTNSIKKQDQKSFYDNQLDLSETFHIVHKSNQKQLGYDKIQKSLIHDAINRKFISQKTEIIVYFFNTNKRIIFTKIQLNKKFIIDPIKSDNPKRQLPLIKYLIPYLIKKYCQLFFNFQPLQIQHQNFQLKLANQQNQNDPLIDPFSHDQQLLWLFQCDNLVLIRKQKDYQRFKVWKKTIQENQSLQSDMEVIEIIIPSSQNQIIQQFDKNKDINFLKQKIPSCNQLGNIIIVTYSNLTICPPQKKISQIVTIDRILQVYRLEMNTYQDLEHPTKKQNTQLCLQSLPEPPLTQKQTRSLTDVQFEVNQSFCYGKLYLQILGTRIIQKYQGGIFNLFLGTQRRIQRSVHTLVGISCDKMNINMKFLTKSGTELCLYQFQSRDKVQGFFKSILKIGRQLKQNFQKIDF